MRTVSFDFPLPRTHCGVALGNGNLGALVWGKEKLHITVSLNDLWDTRNGLVLEESVTYERLKAAYDPHNREMFDRCFHKEDMPPFPPSVIPGGRFEIAFRDHLAPGRAELDCETGQLRVSLEQRTDVGDGSDSSDGPAQPAGGLLLVLDPFRNLLYVEDAHALIAEAKARPAWEWVRAIPEEEGSVRWSRWYLEERGFTPPEPINGEEGVGWAQELPADPAAAFAMRETDQGRLVAVARGADGAAARNAAADLATAFSNQGRDRFLSEGEAWWRAFWAQTPEVSIPSDFFSTFLTCAQYKFACATNPNADLPAPLQGPWYEEYQMPPWEGCYTLDVNIEQIYTLAFHNGNYAHLMPLFDWLESEPVQRAMRWNAKTLLGAEDGLLISHAVTSLGEHAQLKMNGHSAVDQSVAGWLAQLYWLYYRYTLDETFLRERAFPFMQGAMRVFEGLLEDRDGKLTLPFGPSPEYGVTGFSGPRVGPNPSVQFACVHMLVAALIDAAKILGETPRSAWEDIRNRLPRYTLVGEEKKRIGIWENTDLERCHRHHSHLAAIYPFDSLGESTPEQREILDETIDRWILVGQGQWSEWSMPWASIIHSRLGQGDSARAIMNTWRDVFVNESLATVYIPRFSGMSVHRKAFIDLPKEKFEIMQLDGTMAGATAIYEMLIHTRGDTVYIFPGVSEKWQDVSFSNVRVPGRFAVGAERRGGRTTGITITCEKGGEIRLAVPDRKTMYVQRGGVAVPSGTTVTFPALFRMEPGEEFRLGEEHGA